VAQDLYSTYDDWGQRTSCTGTQGHVTYSAYNLADWIDNHRGCLAIKTSKAIPYKIHGTHLRAYIPYYTEAVRC
jgi:hypothetical protein